jgi:hypothetical protein
MYFQGDKTGQEQRHLEAGSLQQLQRQKEWRCGAEPERCDVCPSYGSADVTGETLLCQKTTHTRPRHSLVFSLDLLGNSHLASLSWEHNVGCNILEGNKGGLYSFLVFSSFPPSPPPLSPLVYSDKHQIPKYHCHFTTVRENKNKNRCSPSLSFVFFCSPTLSPTASYAHQ